jgi:hypothetical protein
MEFADSFYHRNQRCVLKYGIGTNPSEHTLPNEYPLDVVWMKRYPMKIYGASRRLVCPSGWYDNCRTDDGLKVPHGRSGADCHILGTVKQGPYRIQSRLDHKATLT